MTRTRYLLALAKLQAEQRRMLGVFATTADLDLVVVEDANQALLWLERHDASVILFDASAPKAERLCHKARAKRSLSGIPILAMSNELTDVFTEKLYGLGVDDVVSSSAWPALIARLRSLPRQDAPIEPPKLGRAVVADSDRSRCDVIGHVLANAGFELRYASDERVLQYYTTQDDVRLVVATAELAEPRGLIERARAAGSQAAFIIMSSKREIDGHTHGLADLLNVATISQNSPPDDLLFLANELTSGKTGSGRSSERVLYGTSVAFRKSGGESDDSGFTYNISGKGMYIRTLAPPDGDLVWLELRPPRAKERVRLEGQVIWKCPFGRAVGASAPSGFAVHLTDGLGDGLRAWVECYEFHVGSKRAGIGGGLTQRISNRAEADGSDEGPSPASLDALAQAIVGGYSEPSMPVARQTDPPTAKASQPPLASERPTASQPPSASQPLVGKVSEAPKAGASEPAPPPAPPPAPAPAELAEPAPTPSNVAEPPRAAPGFRESRRPPLIESEPPPFASGSTRKRGAIAAIAGVALLGVGGGLIWSADSGSTPPETTAHSPLPSANRAPPEPTHTVPDPAPSSSAPEAGGATPADAPDPARLPRDQGILFVASSANVKVYLNGRLTGATNTPLTVHCGARFIRLGTDTFGQWLSEGNSVAVACRKTTRVQVEPSK